MRDDGDTVIAVVNGVAGASDGKSLGLTASRQEGQVRALRRAYAQSGIAPEEVGMVEAHGTGTVVGDKTELATLETVFAAAPTGGVAPGSVKSQIGHTKCAAAGRCDQGRPGRESWGPTSDLAHRYTQPRLESRGESVRIPRPRPPVGGARSPRGNQRVRIRRNQLS